MSSSQDLMAGPPLTDVYVVHTDWQPWSSNKPRVRHVYGPYTQSKARSVARKFTRDATEGQNVSPGVFKATVHLLLDERKWQQ